MNTIILLICVLSNIAFSIIGFMAGRKVQIIELHKGDSLIRKESVEEDEPAFYLDPETEAKLNAEYQARIHKESGKDGI